MVLEFSIWKGLFMKSPYIEQILNGEKNLMHVHMTLGLEEKSH